MYIHSHVVKQHGIPMMTLYINTTGSLCPTKCEMLWRENSIPSQNVLVYTGTPSLILCIYDVHRCSTRVFIYVPFFDSSGRHDNYPVFHINIMGRHIGKRHR